MQMDQHLEGPESDHATVDISKRKLESITADYILYGVILSNLIWIPICFLVFYLNYSDERYNFDGVRQIPTISLTGNHGFGLLVFTYGLHLEAFLLFFAFTAIYIVTERKIDKFCRLRNEDVSIQSGETSMISYISSIRYLDCCTCTANKIHKKSLHQWNWIALIIGLICAVLMSFVGTVPLKVNTTVHSYCAFFMYFAGIGHMLIFYYRIKWFTDYPTEQIHLTPEETTVTDALAVSLAGVDTVASGCNVDGNDHTGTHTFSIWKGWTDRRIHGLCLFMSVPFNIILFIIFMIVKVNCSTTACYRFILDTGVAMEYLVTLCLVVYTGTFVTDLKTIKIFHYSTIEDH